MMGNHTVECEHCGEDLRGLTGGHSPNCPRPGRWTDDWEHHFNTAYGRQLLRDARADDDTAAMLFTRRLLVSACELLREAEVSLSPELEDFYTYHRRHLELERRREERREIEEEAEERAEYERLHKKFARGKK